jgi:rubrerythrin
MIPTTETQIVDALNDLIQLDYDASKTYEQALEYVHEDDREVRADLESFRLDHLRHIEELSRLVAAEGGTPLEPVRDVKGALLEGLTRLRSVTGTLGALKAMRLNEKLTNRSYDHASELALSPRARDLISANLEDERRHLAAIEAHISRLHDKGHRHDDDDDDYDDDLRSVRNSDNPFAGVRM